MRLYRVSNGRSSSAWVFAEDETQARTVFFEEGRVRHIENIRRVEDQTDFYRLTTDLDSVDVSGLAAIECPSMQWSIVRRGRLVWRAGQNV